MKFPSISEVNELREATNHWGFVEGLYLAGNDDGIALRLLHGFDYEPESRKLWKSLSKDADIVIDIGAHTGIYSLDAFKSGAREVLSFEPYLLNFARLVVNLRHAGFNPDGCLPFAISEKNGIYRFGVKVPNYYCTAGGRLGMDEAFQSFPVQVRSLDSLIKPEYDSRIKVIKIDTEGHVLNVLKGMPRILCSKPDLILEVIEDGLTEILKPLGYEFYRINEETGLSPVEDLTPDEPVNHRSPNRYCHG